MPKVLRKTVVLLLALSAPYFSLALAKPRADASQPTQGYPLSIFQQRIREANRRLAALSRVIQDSDLLQYARTPFDKGAKMLKREYLGANHGELVVVDFPCSDVCPQYTKRIIHYDVSANRGDCFAAGGVIREEDVPTGIANESVKFCEPRILVK